VAFGCLPQDFDVHNQVADLLLQLLDLLLAQGFLVLGLRSESVLCCQQSEAFLPFLELRDGDAVLPSRCLGTGLSLEDAQNQGCLAFGRPALDVLFLRFRNCLFHPSPPSCLPYGWT
jgi:hypothetical protein